MITIAVKFNNGLYKVFDNVQPDMANYRDGILTIVSGDRAMRMPLVNIMYFETIEKAEGSTVEGEGRVKE